MVILPTILRSFDPVTGLKGTVLQVFLKKIKVLPILSDNRINRKLKSYVDDRKRYKMKIRLSRFSTSVFFRKSL